ncbi:LOW QUALITY PROTEIN: formin-like protein 4 [Populus alba]|uniref:LOW QUALITY PROTEIN: formin-like protein 4 n=1 Tax=Populus alba TaxID=43335 RepID=UPI003CC729E6
MAAIKQPWHVLHVMFFLSVIPFSSSQSNSPRNIETFYPFPAPKPTASPNSTSMGSSVPARLPPSSSNRNVIKAVAATAASTFVVAILLFFLIQRFILAPRRRKEGDDADSGGGQTVASASQGQFSRVEGNVKGVVVDENGLDVPSWRKHQVEDKKNSSRKQELRRKSEPAQEIPLIRGKFSISETKVVPETTVPTVSYQSINAIEKPKTSQPSNLPLARSPTPPPQSSMAIPNKQVPEPPPPPTNPAKQKHQPPKAAGLAASSNLPPFNKGESGESSTGQGSTSAGTRNGQVKVKPLHRDKVIKNTGHSMAWDKIDGGSFRVDDDLMEALFGFVATNRKSPKRDNSSNSKNLSSIPPAQIFILDARKSQNMATVLKSLSISRNELLDALTNGHGLNADTLDKLMRIAPTKEEESQILEFSGNPTRLADAESFLFYLLKAVPSAFGRLSAMLFRSNYDAEILHFKESLQIVDSGCTELRNRGLFIKLLEAILKAGNSQAFNPTSLRKLSDVKSTDGKTTLLHFVVKEVVRSEGKRYVLNRNRSLSRNISQRSNSSSVISEISTSKEKREKEYMMLGLPAVGGLSTEFSNVKKAALIDYVAFASTCSVLEARAREVRAFVSQCAPANGEGGFVKEMKGFLEAAEEELKSLTKEQTRVMELVKKTTEYYHAGASKDQEAHEIQLFATIKDFLYMVDQACVMLARNLQRKTPSSSIEPSPKSSRMPVRFPNLPERFMLEKSMSSSSESDSDFYNRYLSIIMEGRGPMYIVVAQNISEHKHFGQVIFGFITLFASSYYIFK